MSELATDAQRDGKIKRLRRELRRSGFTHGNAVLFDLSRSQGYYPSDAAIEAAERWLTLHAQEAG